MKYLVIITFFTGITIYIILELIIKTILNIIYFLWDFDIKKKYLPYKKVYNLVIEDDTYKTFITYKQIYAWK